VEGDAARGRTQRARGAGCIGGMKRGFGKKDSQGSGKRKK